MIGLLIGLVGTFFEEINNSIFKDRSKKYDILKLGVITSFFGILFFLLSGLYKYFFTNIEIYLNPKSIPLLSLRLFLEIIQSFVTLLAIKYSDRSTFSIIRILTIPLLVISDIILGYQFSVYSLVGIGIIVFSFFIFNLKLKTIDFKGWYFVLFTAINAVFTISLFKYSISHFGNSVEVDQFLAYLSILIFFVVYNYIKNKTCALKLIVTDKYFLMQGISLGLATLFLSYSYLFLNASEATSIKRAGEMFWSILTGFIFFKEKHFLKKIFFAIFIVIGLVVMMF